MADLPSNVHVSSHPCVRAKISQLRSQSATARQVRELVHEISLIVGCDALGHSLSVQETNEVDQSPLGYSYKCESVTPYKIALVPILRSGLSMIDAFTSLLPHPVPIHHLGLYREKSTMQPVEYYNKLHNHKSSTADPTQSSGPADLAIIVDPVIATGATACAAVESLRDWGVKKVIVCSVIASRGGLINVAKSWDGVEVFVGGCDAETDANGMIKPGLGDIGDRLFLTVGT